MSKRLTTHHLDALVLAGGESKRIAVVSDQQAVEDTPHYSFQELDILAQQIEAQVLNRAI